MEIDLAAKNNDVKDNYPAGDINIHFKRKENETQH